MSTSSPPAPLTLEELVLLTDEFGDLVRAGVPLDLGFRTTAARMPGRIRRLSEELALQLERGATLPEALRTLGNSFPGPYRTLVEVGSRTGQLEEVLRSLSTFSGTVREMQKTLATALFYPVALLVIGYLLLITLVVFAIPSVVFLYQDLRVAPPVWIRVAETLGTGVAWWGPGIPIVVVLGLLVNAARRPQTWQPAPDLAGLGRFLPGMRRAIQESEISRFGQLLALLIEAQVPLPEALPLVAEGVSDPEIRTWCAAEVRRSEVGASEPAADSAGRIPALMAWFLRQENRDGDLPFALRQMADLYRERALARMQRIVHFWPVAATLGIGLLFVGAYATVSFGTLIDLWGRLGQ